MHLLQPPRIARPGPRPFSVAPESLSRRIRAFLLLPALLMACTSDGPDHAAPAQDTDGLRDRARQIMAEGEERRSEGTPEARLQAIEMFQEASELCQRADDHDGQAEAQNLIGLAYRGLRELDRAIEHYNEARSLWRQARNTDGEIEALNNIAVARRGLGQTEQALNLFGQALAAARETENRPKEAETLNKIGFTHRFNGAPGLAVDFYQQSLDIRRELDDVPGMVTSLNNLGAAFDFMTEYQQSLTRYHEALDFLARLDDVSKRATVLNNTGAAYSALGQFEEASFYLRQALSYTTKPRNEARTYTNLCRAQHFLGDLEEALRSCGRAVMLLTQIRDPKTEAAANTNLGRTYFALGDSGKALDFYQKALEILASLQHPLGEATTLTQMAFIYIDRDEPRRARDELDRALALSRSIGNRTTESMALLGLAELRRLESDPAAALDYVEEAVGIVESLRGRVAEPDLRATFLATKRRLYETRFSLLMELGQEARALGASEQARARSLVDMLAEARIEVETSPGAIQQTEPRILGLAEIQRFLDPDTVLLEYALSNDESFLWVVTASSIRSWTLPGREEVEAAALEVHRLLTARAERAPEERSRQRRRRIERADADYPAAASRLTEILLGPAAEHLSGSRLVVVTEGALGLVPFAALPSPQGLPGGDPVAAGPPLIVSFEIVRLPSASALAFLRRDVEPAPDSQQVLVVADPVFDRDDSRLARIPDGPSVSEPADDASAEAGSTPAVRQLDYQTSIPLPRLRSSEDEARMIEGRLTPGQATVMLGFGATLAALKKADLASYRILHFATHGVLNSRDPGRSALVFSRFDRRGSAVDGFLRLGDIYQLDLRADLVVLSACRTALGREIRGEGLVGLTRGFMYAGTTRVMASLWTVQDVATRELMNLFYEGMMDRRERPAAALRQAQVAMWSGPQFEDLRAPYYWAAFVLQGDWR